MPESELYQKGAAMRRRLMGDAAVERSAREIYSDPVMKKFIDVATETVFGALWTRPGLDLKTRALICVISDAATGREPELALHLRMALRQGWTETELSEALLPPVGLCRRADHPRIDDGGEQGLCRAARRAGFREDRGLTKHILVVPSWYSNGRGSGGGYFRDQALALGAAGYRVAILAPDIHTWRDRRTRPIPPQPRDHARVESDGVPVYRRNDFTALPRVPYRNSLVWTRCGMKLFRRYVSDRGRPDLVHAHSCLHAGVLALAIERRYGIPFVVTEHSTGFAQSRLRWWERDLVRRVLKRAGRCIAVSPHLAELMEQQYPASSWRYLPNVLGEAFLSAAPATAAHRERLPVRLSVRRPDVAAKRL